MGFNNKLLVEGKDDEKVIIEILRYFDIPQNFEIMQSGKGVEKLLNKLKTILKQSQIEKIGIIVDADTDLTSRWQSIRDRLLKIGYNSIPVIPQPDGTIMDAPSEMLPTVGVWIMPNNQIPGILENFIQWLVPDMDPLLEYAKKCVREIPPENQRFPNNQKAKAEIHTWLSWQREPGTPLGNAINQKYLNPDCEPAKMLIKWINRLF